MNIFERLNKKKVCYMVEMSYIYPIMKGIKDVGIEYNIVILKRDKPMIEDILFSNYSDKKYKHANLLMQRGLSGEDMEAFRRARGHHLQLVVDNQYGKIYEKVGDSFKSRFQKFKKKVKA